MNVSPRLFGEACFLGLAMILIIIVLLFIIQLF